MLSSIFNSQTISKYLNKTYICLIAKLKNANLLKKLHPVGLYNTIYKVVINIIANLIKLFLPQLIGFHQMSFLKDRRACDNAILDQEIFNHVSKTNSIKLYYAKVGLGKSF